MRGAIVLSMIALGLAGCAKTQTPTTDPFTAHPIVPPPGTGGYPATTSDPGYSANNSTLQTPAGRPNSTVNPGVSGVPAANMPIGNGTSNGIGNPAVTSNPGYNPAATTSLGNAPTTGYANLGGSNSTTITPPGTATPGGYPNVLANPASMSNPPPLTPGGVNNNTLGTPATPASPITNTPRPTSSRSYSSNTNPTASIPGTSPADSRNPRPFDANGQPLRAPSAYDANLPSNSTAANTTPNANAVARVPQQGVPCGPATHPNQMPMAPTAYGSPLANPPYVASIQTIDDANWQPCDGYDDEGE